MPALVGQEAVPGFHGAGIRIHGDRGRAGYPRAAWPRLRQAQLNLKLEEIKLEQASPSHEGQGGEGPGVLPRKLRRVEQLHAAGSVAADELDQARIRAIAAERDRDVAIADLAMAKAMKRAAGLAPRRGGTDRDREVRPGSAAAQADSESDPAPTGRGRAGHGRGPGDAERGEAQGVGRGGEDRERPPRPGKEAHREAGTIPNGELGKARQHLARARTRPRRPRSRSPRPGRGSRLPRRPSRMSATRAPLIHPIPKSRLRQLATLQVQTGRARLPPAILRNPRGKIRDSADLHHRLGVLNSFCS